MDTDIQMFTVDGKASMALKPSLLTTQGLLEAQHLEVWVVDNPAILGGDVKIVTTQYDRWSSKSGDRAADRLDVLGLDSSGQTVVVELKRGSDSRIHLQAITYAALVAGFDKETLAEAHADYLNRTLAEDERVTVSDALGDLFEHVDGDWEDELLTVPKIVLLAEDFTAQTYTTVQWLNDLTPNLSIEMRTINVFLPADHAESSQPFVVFRRLYPTDDPTTRVLTPRARIADAVVTKIAERKIQARSTYILHDSGGIPEGARLDLGLSGSVKSSTVEVVEAWVADDPDRGQAVWIRDRERPLQWVADRGDETWTPTGLARHIIETATGIRLASIPGGDVWRYDGHTLLELATSLVESVQGGDI